MELLLLMFKLSIPLFFLPVCLYRLFHLFGFKGNYTFALAMGISPAILAWYYMMLLYFFPGKSSIFYLLLTILPFVLFSLKPSILYKFIHEFNIFKPIFHEKLYLFIIAFLLLFIPLWYLNMPLIGNDPMEYFYISRLIDIKKDISFYPDVSGIERGLITPFTHPLGYSSLVAWGMLGLSQSVGFLIGKLFSLLSLLLTLFVASFVQIKEDLKPYLLFSLIFLTIPVVFSQVLQAHLDSLRMLFFFLSFLALYDALKNQGSLILVGVTCGLSWFFHSSGIVTLVMILGAFCFFCLVQGDLFSIRGVKKVFLGSCVILFSSLSFLILDFIKIYSVHGRLVGDFENIHIITLLSHEYQHFVALSRDIGPAIYERLLKCLNLLFFQPLLYGFVYWLAFIGIILNFKASITNLISNKWNYIDYSFFITCLFYVMVTLTISAGSDTFVFNFRYLMQILPFVAFMGFVSLKRWIV